MDGKMRVQRRGYFPTAYPRGFSPPEFPQLLCGVYRPKYPSTRTLDNLVYGEGATRSLRCLAFAEAVIGWPTDTVAENDAAPEYKRPSPVGSPLSSLLLQFTRSEVFAAYLSPQILSPLSSHPSSLQPE